MVTDPTGCLSEYLGEVKRLMEAMMGRESPCDQCGYWDDDLCRHPLAQDCEQGPRHCRMPCPALKEG
jgi:hypothetical protein